MKIVRTSECGELVRVCIYTRATRWDAPRVKRQKQEWRKDAWRKINFRNTREKLEDRVFCNFGCDDWHVCFTLAKDYETTDYQILRQYWRNSLNRLRKYRKRRGAPAPVYIYIMEGLHGDKRLHVHALIQQGSAADIEDFHRCWPYGAVLITKIADFEHRDNLAQYLTKEPSKMGRDKPDRNLFVASRNCIKPAVFSYLIPDDADAPVPDGAKVLHQETIENEFGIFQYIKYRRPSPT